MADWAPYFLMWVILAVMFAFCLWLNGYGYRKTALCLSAVPPLSSTALLLICLYDFAREPDDGIYISAPMRWLMTNDNPYVFEDPVAVATRNGLYLIMGSVLVLVIVCIAVSRKKKEA